MGGAAFQSTSTGTGQGGSYQINRIGPARGPRYPGLGRQVRNENNNQWRSQQQSTYRVQSMEMDSGAQQETLEEGESAKRFEQGNK